MDEQQQNALLLTARVLRFATDHPYAATWLFGAAVGSAVTYSVLTSAPAGSKVFTPKVYEFAMTPEDLHRMSTDPDSSIRLETPDITLVIAPEKRIPLKELPDIDIEG